MGAFIPGMEQHDAVNNGDGFSTGSLNNNNSRTQSNFNNFSNTFTSPGMNQSFNAQQPSNNQQNFNSFGVGNSFNSHSTSNGNQLNNSFNNNENLFKGPNVSNSFNNNQANNSFNNNQVNNSFNNQQSFNQANNLFNSQLNNNQSVSENNGFNQQNVNNQFGGVLQSKTQNIPVVNNNQQIPFKSNMYINRIPQNKKMQINNNIHDVTGATVRNDKQNSDSKIIAIISIIIIVLLLLFIVLYVSGVFKKDTSEKTTESEPVVDVAQQKQEKIITELVAGCNNLSEDGKYGEAVASEKEKCDDWICFHEDNVVCENSICSIVVDDKAYTRYCSTGKTISANKYDTQAGINISELCEILTSQPEHKGTIDTSYGYCSDYECTTTAGGKTYTDTCDENS